MFVQTFVIISKLLRQTANRLRTSSCEGSTKCWPVCVNFQEHLIGFSSDNSSLPLLDHYLRRHLRVNRTAVSVGARFGWCERKLLWASKTLDLNIFPSSTTVCGKENICGMAGIKRGSGGLPLCACRKRACHRGRSS